AGGQRCDQAVGRTLDQSISAPRATKLASGLRASGRSRTVPAGAPPEGLMTFAPGYGETPVSEDHAVSLLPAVFEALGDHPSKAAVYDLEQAVQDEVAEECFVAVFDGSLVLDELLT